MNLGKIIKNLVDKSVKKLGNWRFFLTQELAIPIRRKDCFVPPFRPSKGDTKNYEKILMKTIVKEKFLLLDSASELKDLINSMNIEYTILTPASFLDEFWQTDYFDVIIGDLLLDKIATKSQKIFLSRISDALKNNGLFISRLHSTGKELDNLLINYFIVRDLGLAGDYQDYRFYPIYVLQKR